MQSHTLLTTSGRGSGSEPTTAASSLDGCSGLIRAGLTVLPDEPLPALASLPDVPSAGLALLPEVLFAAGALAFLSGAFLAVSAFLGSVGCLALLGIVDPLPMVQAPDLTRALDYDEGHNTRAVRATTEYASLLTEPLHGGLDQRPCCAQSRDRLASALPRIGPLKFCHRL